jgi:secreted PhoX family phosphatase
MSGRRKFLEQAGAVLLCTAAGAVSRGLPSGFFDRGRAGRPNPGPGFGPLRKDPDGLLDLPPRFSYRVISVAGQKMKDGFLVPSLADGMAAFPGPRGATILLRNHEFRIGHPDELGPFGGEKRLWKGLDKRYVYDWRPDGTPCLGSVTTVVYDTKRKRTRSQHLSLAGTMTNCSGGATPWGTWLSSEEVFAAPGGECAGRHGYTFEVGVSAHPGITLPSPLRAMGRFVKEGVAVDPRTGILYQTEDQVVGLFLRLLCWVSVCM